MEFTVSDRGVKMFQKEKVFYFLNIQIIRFFNPLWGLRIKKYLIF